LIDVQENRNVPKQMKYFYVFLLNTSGFYPLT